MRIVHLGPTGIPVLHQRGGAVQRRMVELARAQAANGHDVTILSSDRVASREVFDGVEIISLATSLPRPWRDLEMLRKSRRVLAQMPPGILHAHGVPAASRMATSLGWRSVLSVDYFRFRWSDHPPLRSHYRRLLAGFDAILPVSAACAAMFRAYWGSPAPISVIFNGVNIEQFHPSQAARDQMRRDLGISDAELVVLYVGRLCAQKGTEVLARAWPQVGSIGPATLLVAGPIEQFGTEGTSQLTDQLAQVGARYLGPVDESSLAALYNACDLFLMPTVIAEMFGMAALEAEACGRPVVASRWGGLLESVAADAGTFVEPGNPDELSFAITDLLEDPERRAAMGRAARQHAERFDWQTIAGDLDVIYEGLP